MFSSPRTSAVMQGLRSTESAYLPGRCSSAIAPAALHDEVRGRFLQSGVQSISSASSSHGSTSAALSIAVLMRVASASAAHWLMSGVFAMHPFFFEVTEKQ